MRINIVKDDPLHIAREAIPLGVSPSGDEYISVAHFCDGDNLVSIYMTHDEAKQIARMIEGKAWNPEIYLPSIEF